MATLVISAVPITPEPFATLQLCPAGLACTLTEKLPPCATGDANTNAPFADLARLSVPLFCNTTVPFKPVIAPLTLYALAEQTTDTLVTLDPDTEPAPLATVHVCLAGAVNTDTLYAAPFGSRVAKVNTPLALTVRLSPPLFCITNDPDKPVTEPPIE
ncbi:hypothetical protein [Paraburkholderia kururiensis]|uniref:hypothetical protein n=1 Tax=Paraburkholderia kururiensis TaxID=984307 RepID=UPI000F884684|nr:hypothetical protein [Paraburkholderia kururiensis]